MKLEKIHHIAIICSNYEVSKAFYTNILGLTIKNEVYRKERNSYKLDLSLNDNYIIELFSFPNSPEQLTQPEAVGMRHLCFGVKNLEENLKFLEENNVQHEGIRTDELTNKKFTFFNDPDNLPIELYEL